MPLSERTKLAIKFWGGKKTNVQLAKEMKRANSWVSYQTDIILETRPRYDNR